MARATFAALVVVSGLLALGGCPRVGKVSHDPEPEPQSSIPPISKNFQSSGDLKPEVLPPKEANLVLASYIIPVELEGKAVNGKLVLTWLADKDSRSGPPVVAEAETYFFSDQGFSLAEAPGERFDPPIRLVKYPLSLGDTWDWSGKLQTGATAAKATAKVTASEAVLNIPYGNFSALLVTADIHVEQGTEGAKRTFKFWFQPGKGLIKREFGQSSSREPRVEHAKPVE